MSQTVHRVNIKLKAHNSVFKCFDCEEMKNAKKDQPIFVTAVLAAQNVNGGLQVNQQLMPICQDCFDANELEEKDSGIHVATQMPNNNGVK